MTFGIREMAGMLNRSPSTISRELSRNSGTEGYASAQAREQSTQRRKAARPAIKLHADALLFDVVGPIIDKQVATFNQAPSTSNNDATLLNAAVAA